MTAWKACDLRGPFPGEVSGELFEKIGAAFASGLPLRARVVVAGDFRESTPVLKRALMEGLLGAGARVLDAGQVPTPLAYFAQKHWRAHAVTIVTASHNPPDHNGLKLMTGSLPATPEDLGSLRHRTESGRRRRAEGCLETINPAIPYREWILERWRGSDGLRVVLDAGNGAWSELGPEVFETLGFEVHRLFCEFDGRYPNRAPDSARAENLNAVREAVVRTGARLGIAWDGDGDRVAFVDETGSVARADEIAVLLARHLLEERRGEKVVHDIKLSDVVRREVLAAGGVPIMERSGHSFLKTRMIVEDCLFGCEASGHYFHGELEGGDDGLFTALLTSQVVAEGGSLSRLRKTVPPIFATPDLRLPAEAVPFAETVEKLRELFPGAKETRLDGLRLETAFGTVLLRESVTEPVVTLSIEGCDREALRRLARTCLRAAPLLEERIAEWL
ncbi:MAG: phosphomannomutase/phosphoglucomutase [Bryobacterales bacterium]|nr:phosphomannomutase/phosphoglucomutase [Bryobacterales bacterium]